MKLFFKGLFLLKWERKVISLILAVIIWLIVNHSLSTSKVLEGVAVRLVNLPIGTTVEGMQPTGLLSQGMTLTISGNKTVLDEVNPADLEVVVDATDKTGDWWVSVSKKNLHSLSPGLDLNKSSLKVLPSRLHMELTRLLTEQIPVVVTRPIGEAPRDYQFLDIWPYRLSLTLSGPENIIRQLKAKGLNLALNLDHIARSTLDAIHGSRDEVSFFIPDEWKKISIPSLSDQPFVIDDPEAKELRIDFLRSDLHPLGKTIPISLFYPPEYSLILNPETHLLVPGGIIERFHGLYLIRKSLYAKGVSRLFVELVRDMVEVSVILAPRSERHELDWSVQFINPRLLEDRYVSMLLSDGSEEGEVISKRREEVLRNRFRNYMNRFQLYISGDTKFDLNVELRGKEIVIRERSERGPAS